MIRLDVQGYCAECCDFESDIAKPVRDTVRSSGGIIEVIQTDTIVRCKYAKRCENIRRFLEKHKEDTNE